MMHPVGPMTGNRFEAVWLPPEGWVVLTPWVRTPEGHWWRPHVLEIGAGGPDKKFWAEHMARQLNEHLKET